MINKRKLRAIEKELKERLKPDIIKYVRLDNGKIFLIMPGLQGIATELNYIFCGDAKERDFNLDAVRREFPGLELMDYTEENLEMIKYFENFFDK
jgi:hypothetical protein